MEVSAHPMDNERFMHKGRLQVFTQKAAMPLPIYVTVSEGDAHARKFRSTVVVDGITFTSSNSFSQRRAAEQDVAKFALESISKKIENEGAPSIQEDTTFCKSILHEYAEKLKLKKPVYTTSRVEGIRPIFTTFSIFNEQTYIGVPAENPKEAERMAARAVTVSILANSNTRLLMYQIIRSKEKQLAALCKKRRSYCLSSERNVSSGSHSQNNPNDTANVKDVSKNLTINKLPENICSGDGQISEASTTETFSPEAKKLRKECTCELSYGTVGNGNSEPSLQQGGSPTAMTNNTSDCADWLLVHDQINEGVKQLGLSTRPEDSAGVVLTRAVKRSNIVKNGGNQAKKLLSWFI